MKILKLQLKGYKRLKLNNIEYIELTPENKIQLILGSNGSGKSSLMKELSPLPGIPNEYDKDGYKIIHIQHNSNLYILRSMFSSSGNKFNFIKNEEELNPGGTVTVYKDLVKSEFNITQDVHDLMTGNKLFHEMSSNERRSWFTKISDIDYTYAFNYYNNLKEQLRDTQGAIKHNQSRLVQETAKLLSKDDETNITNELISLKDLLTIILNNKATVTYTNDDNIENTIISISNDLLSKTNLIQSYINNNNIDINNLDAAIIEQQSILLFYNQVRLNDIYKNIEELRTKLSIIEKSNITDSKNIDKDLYDYEQELISHVDSLRYNVTSDDNKQALLALNTVADLLVSIFTTIDINANKEYSREKYILLIEAKNKLSAELDSANKIQNINIVKQKELEHYKEHGKIECPKCNHIWYKGYDERTYVNLLSNIKITADKINELTESIKKTDASIDNIKEYLEHYRNYINITKNWPILNSLWEYLLNNSLVFNNPRQIPNIINSVRQEFIIQIKIDGIIEKIKNLNEVKKLTSNNAELNSQLIKEEILKLENNLVGINNKTKLANNVISNLNIIKQLIVDVNALTVKLKTLLTNRKSNYKNKLEHLRNNYLNESIRLIQLEITNKELIVSKIATQKALVDNIEKQLIELNNKYELLKIATKELSPTEGLIAESLAGFINHFVLQVNNFIKKIWLYPLQLIPVLPNEDEDLDLDYKFSVKINENITIPDISKASSAMKEVIDLAFKLISMQYLKLQYAPIFLDEFGSKMDHAHRASAFYAITNLLASSNFSQIFMISHYEDAYGSLKNSDIIVLCSANIVIPKDTTFNNTIVIK